MIPTQWYAASIAAIASIARLQGSMVWSYIFLNGFCMGLSIKNHSDLIIRLGTMTSINVIPLFLGSRTSLVADFLGFSLHTYYLTHHWIGRVVIIQNLLHVGLGYVCVTPWTFDSSPISRISSTSVLALLLLLSLYLTRTLIYEVFFFCHSILALVAVATNKVVDNFGAAIIQ